MEFGQEFTATLHNGNQTKYLSYVVAGLHELRAANGLRLSYAKPPADLPTPMPHAQSWLTLCQRTTRHRLRIFFDLKDAPDLESSCLGLADVYFKRSLAPARHADLTQCERQKLLPLGIHYPCTSRHETLPSRLRAALAAHGALRTRSPSRRMAAALLRRWADDRWLRSLPPYIDQLECRPSTPAQPKVYFRTRLIDPDSAETMILREEIIELNEQRVALIRTLQQRLGERFVGGLYPTATTTRLHPELIFRLPDNLQGQRGHLTLSRRYAIAINTAGVHNSTGWKLPECMAASRCIVTEPPRYDNLTPPEPGRDYLAFTSPAECANVCEELLHNNDAIAQIRANAYAYYQDYVAPRQALGRALRAAWKVSAGDGVAESA